MDSHSQSERSTIFTIGHSNHPIDGFLDLLRQHGIQVLVDTRSQPYSKYASQFNSQPLREGLEANGIRYVFQGRELGGRPQEDRFYDEKGYVLYGRIAQSEAFRKAIQELLIGIQDQRIALLCSEEDPRVCHRKLLISRALRERGVQVLHIRGDGHIEDDADLDREANQQGSLFEEEEEDWKSIRSVSPRNPPQTSLER
ncbi:MAG TPA: DUF488 domain-containing protein [Chthonomonadaceae bacterium]|nr:DUF488 domain-containing protein [Chthonomonadaceae bacterium]